MKQAIIGANLLMVPAEGLEHSRYVNGVFVQLINDHPVVSVFTSARPDYGGRLESLANQIVRCLQQ